MKQNNTMEANKFLAFLVSNQIKKMMTTVQLFIHLILGGITFPWNTMLPPLKVTTKSLFGMLNHKIHINTLRLTLYCLFLSC